MKRILAFVLSAPLLLALAGCSSAPKNEVNVFNWGVYIDESVLEDFQQQTGIKVNYDTFESNEAMYGKLKNEDSSYDVVIPSDYMIARMIEEDMLQPIDMSSIPNFSDIDPALKNPSYDPENKYSVPYMWGILGIIYNTTMVDGDVDSWGVMFDEQYAGKILMFDNPRDSFGIALKYLGFSYNTTNETEIRSAVDLLIAQKPLVHSLVMDDIFDKLQGGVAAIGSYYYGDYLTMLEENPDLAFCLPREGTNIYTDAMCIPKNAPNKSNAEQFINFMCSTEIGLRNCEETYYSTPLLSVRAALDDEIVNDAFAYPDPETLAQCEAYDNLPQETLDLYSSEWLRLKS